MLFGEMTYNCSVNVIAVLLVVCLDCFGHLSFLTSFAEDIGIVHTFWSQAK